MTADPHKNAKIHREGAPLAGARLAIIALHGRHGHPEDILKICRQLKRPDIAILAPEAANNSWWPESFLAPLEKNIKGLQSALNLIDQIIALELQPNGHGPQTTALLGFSQGACLALEHACRCQPSCQTILALSGGLLGSTDKYGRKHFDYKNNLKKSRVYLSVHDKDPVIPLHRIEETAAVLGEMGAEVEFRAHKGATHAVLPSDIRCVRGYLTAGLGQP